MDIDLYWVLIFIFFVVMPILERVLKGRSGGGQQRRPPSRLPDAGSRPLPGPREQPRPEMRPQTRGDELQRQESRQPTQAGTDPERAEEMIPAELWEILTGQRRPPMGPVPAPDADIDEELEQDEEAVPARARRDEETAAAELKQRRGEETARRRIADREPPKIVSLETEIVPEPVRHAAFHQQVAAAKTAAPPPRAASRVSHHALAVLLRNPSDLRRGIILQEVLGRPKGLE